MGSWVDDEGGVVWEVYVIVDVVKGKFIMDVSVGSICIDMCVVCLG